MTGKLRFSKAIMRSHKFQLSAKHHLPIRLRLSFLLFTILVLVFMGLLGFTNLGRSWPINDKVLHFVFFGVATLLFYFIFDVEEDARRIWIWRQTPLIATVFVCFFCGGIISEYVQGMTVYRNYQFGDIVANLLGCSLGLYIAWHLEKYYRHRREIARLYRPLHSGLGLSNNSNDYDDESDNENDMGTQLLPTTHSNRTKLNAGPVRLGDVWNTREELFSLEDSDDEDDEPLNPGTPVPKITVTAV